jgi:hypothetical protein
MSKANQHFKIPFYDEVDYSFHVYLCTELTMHFITGEEEQGGRIKARKCEIDSMVHECKTNNIPLD